MEDHMQIPDTLAQAEDLWLQCLITEANVLVSPSSLLLPDQNKKKKPNYPATFIYF